MMKNYNKQQDIIKYNEKKKPLTKRIIGRTIFK